jgi:hypothetical protein
MSSRNTRLLEYGLPRHLPRSLPAISTINSWMAEHSPNPVIFPHLQRRGVEGGSDRMTVLEEEERRLDSNATSSSSRGTLDDQNHSDYNQCEAANSSVEKSPQLYAMSTCSCTPNFQGTSRDMHKDSCSMERLWQTEKVKTRLVPPYPSCLLISPDINGTHEEVSKSQYHGFQSPEIRAKPSKDFNIRSGPQRNTGKRQARIRPIKRLYHHQKASRMIAYQSRYQTSAPDLR